MHRSNFFANFVGNLNYKIPIINPMKKKFRKALAEKCSDFGLTDKALDTLTELGSAGLKDDASDEDIATAVDSLVPYAKAMQAETTRKTQNKDPKQSAKQSDTEGNGEGENQTAVPEWFAAYQKRLETLEKENSDLKAEKAATTRAQQIADKAKKLGIPDFLIAGRTFAEDADLDKELADFKQQLVNHNLVPKGQAHETVTPTAQMQTEEDAWAKSLPDK